MRQLMEWEEYFSIEPFGDDQHEARHGQLCALLANCNRDSKTKPDPFKPVDFTRWAGQELNEVELTEEQIEREIDRILGV